MWNKQWQTSLPKLTQILFCGCQKLHFVGLKHMLKLWARSTLWMTERASQTRLFKPQEACKPQILCLFCTVIWRSFVFEFESSFGIHLVHLWFKNWCEDSLQVEGPVIIRYSKVDIVHDFSTSEWTNCRCNLLWVGASFRAKLNRRSQQLPSAQGLRNGECGCRRRWEQPLQQLRKVCHGQWIFRKTWWLRYIYIYILISFWGNDWWWTSEEWW